MKILYKTDADVNAWTYYEKMYKDRMIIDIKKLKNSKGRLSGSIIYENEKLKSVDKDFKGNVIMDLSGECLFNFNKKNMHCLWMLLSIQMHLLKTKKSLRKNFVSVWEYLTNTLGILF